MAETKLDPVRPTDDGARRLARTLLRTARIASLATLTPGSGHPFASLVSLATDIDGAPLILTSQLSGHTGNLEADPRASLLLYEGGKGDPLAHPRITLIAAGERIARDAPDAARIRRRFLARQPKAALYVDFGDFAFWRFKIARASLNGGFGKAFELTPDDLLLDPDAAPGVAEMEEGAVAHMNDDHADALALYATRLAGAPAGRWRCTGIDAEGIDLACGDLATRVFFPEPMADAAGLRTVLVNLAQAARAKM